MANLAEVMQDVDKLDMNNPQDMESLVQAITGGAVDPGEVVPAPAEGDLPKSEDDKGAAAPTETPAPAATPSAEPAQPAAAATPAAPAAPATPEAQGVLAKDGKNVLPFSVLEATRKQKADAEARLQEERSRNEELQKELEAVKAGKSPTDKAPPTADALRQQIEELEANAETLAEEAPWLAEAQKKTVATMKAMLAVVESVQQAPAAAPAAQAQPADDPVQAAIDAIPGLAYIQSANEAAWKFAVTVDTQLRDTPQWKGKSYEERFAHVLTAVRATYGDEIFPDEIRQAMQQPQEKPAPAAPAAKPAPAAGPAINSLTDLPGGTPTAQNPLQAMDAASPTAIAQSLAKLENPDDIIRFVTQAP